MSAKHEVHTLLSARIMKVFSVAMASNKVALQQVLPDIDVAPWDICSKYKVCMISTANL